MRTHTRAFILVLAVIGITSLLPAAEILQLSPCDSDADYEYVNDSNATHAYSDDCVEGSKSLHVSLGDAASGNAYFQGVFWDAEELATEWLSSEGISFWTRSDSGATWGKITLQRNKVIDAQGDNAWPLLLAKFPITSSWTKVIIPWREFTQEAMSGSMEESLGTVNLLYFQHCNGRESTYPYTYASPIDFLIDDIQLVDSLTLAPTPWPSSPDVPIVRAKLAAQQPVKIVVLAASIAHGATDVVGDLNDLAAVWSTQLETELKTHYGYSNVTVINRSNGGHGSTLATGKLGDYVYDEPGVDLVIFADFDHNDYLREDNVFTTTTECANANADNLERIFGMLRRDTSCEIMWLFEALRTEDAAALNMMDPAVTAIRAMCANRNILEVSVYEEFKAYGWTWLKANYYAPHNGDSGMVHFDEAAHTRVKEVVFDAIIGANLDAGTIAFDADSETAVEGAGATVDLTVQRTGGSIGEVSVSYATVDVTALQPGDYTTKTGTLTWDDGNSDDKTITVSLANDAVAESNETFTVTLSSPTNGAELGTIDTSTVTIIDDDAPGTVGFSSSAYSVNEATSDVAVTVQRTGGAMGAISITITAQAGSTATPVTDYTGLPAIIDFTSGEAGNKSFTISPVNDTAEEGNETILLSMAVSPSSYEGSPLTAALTIIDDDTVTTSEGTEGGCSFTGNAGLPVLPMLGILIMLVLYGSYKPN